MRLPAVRSARQAKKAEEERKRSLVTADLRGDDYFPSELLAELPAAQPAARESGEGGKAERRRQAKRERQAAAAAEAAEAPQRAPQDGLPQVVRTEHNIDIAVLPSATKGRQAPVKDGLDDFLKKALYGRGIRRMDSGKMASLKPQASRRG